MFKVLFSPIAYISSLNGIVLQFLACVVLISICLVLFKYIYEKFYTKAPVKKKRKSKRKVVHLDTYVSGKPSEFWKRVDAIENFFREHRLIKTFVDCTIIVVVVLIIKKITGL